MSDKIEFNDIFAEDAFKKGVEGMNDILNAFKQLSNEMKQSLSLQKQYFDGFKPKSVEDIKKLNDEIAKTEKMLIDYQKANDAVKQSEIELQKIEQERIKTAKLNEQLKREQLKTDQQANKAKEKQLSLYQQESKKLNDLRNAYKNLAIAGRENGVVAKGLLQDITALDAKLKKVDASVGQFQRNVGNYTGALDTLKTGFVNILGAAGVGFGLSEGISFLKESFAEFTNAEKATKELSFALNNIGGEGTAALEKLVNQADALEESLGLFESEDIQVLQKSLVNLGASSTQIEALTPKILDLAKATGMDLTSATDVVVKAINGQTKGLKEVGLEFENTGSRTENYNILLEKLDKFQGAAAASAETLEGKQQRIAIAWGNIKEAIGGYLAEAGGQLLDNIDVLTGKTTLWGNALKNVTPLVDDISQSILKNNAQQAAYKELQKQTLAILSDENLSLAEKNKKLEIINKQVVSLTNALNNQTKASKRNQQTFLDDVIGEGEDKIKKAQDDKIKSTGTFEEALLKAEEERLKEEEQINFYYDQAKKEREVKQREEDFEAAQKEADRLLAIEEKRLDDEAKLKKEADDKAKKEREENLKELFNDASKILALAEKEIKEKEKLREDALNKEIDDRKENVDRQRELAEKGLSNTLAFEEKKLAEAERKKEDEAKKALKREKTIAFFKLFASNAEKDPSTALQKTIVETLLADAVAGAFFKGTEKVSDDLKGNKVHNGRDGYVVAVDGSERVMTGEQNKMIGDMTNDELAQLASDYQNGVFQKMAINDSLNATPMASNVYSSMQLQQLVNLNKKIESLETTIKNKREITFAIDEFGNIVKSQIENGIKVVDTIKTKRRRI